VIDRLGMSTVHMASSPFPPTLSMPSLPVANPGQQPGQQHSPSPPRYRKLVIILVINHGAGLVSSEMRRTYWSVHGII
jgi:hypothetical protein